MEKVKFTQNIIVEYTQSGGAPGQPFAPIHYTLEMQATSYEQALEFLGNIMKTCNGIIKTTTIVKINE